MAAAVVTDSSADVPSGVEARAAPSPASEAAASRLWGVDHQSGSPAADERARLRLWAEDPFPAPRKLADGVDVRDGEECVICFDDLKTHIAVPCGHLCVCESCSASLQSCPICRGSVERWMKVHIA